MNALRSRCVTAVPKMPALSRTRCSAGGRRPHRSGRCPCHAVDSLPAVRRRFAHIGQPGPLHAFYDARTRARRGHGKAIVATARKLAVLFWCMLTRGEDYAHQQPSLTKKKLRQLEITAGAPKYAKSARGIWSTNLAIRQAERELAAQAEASYKRLVTGPTGRSPGEESGRERDTGARMK